MFCFNEAESTPTPHLKCRVGANCCLPASPSSLRAGPRSRRRLLQHGHGANRAGLIESWNICLNITVPPTPPPKSLGLGLSPFHRSPKTSWLALAGERAALKSPRQGHVGSQPHRCPSSLISPVNSSSCELLSALLFFFLSLLPALPVSPSFAQVLTGMVPSQLCLAHHGSGTIPALLRLQ